MIGSIPSRRRTFKLFWSRLDRNCFVAVQLDNGHIITVIPPNRFQISESDLVRLVKLEERNDLSDDELALIQKPPRHYHFKIFFFHPTDGVRSKRYEIPVTDYPDFTTCFPALQYMESVQNKLIELISKNIRQGERLYRVIIRVHEKYEPFWVPWNIYAFHIYLTAKLWAAAPRA